MSTENAALSVGSTVSHLKHLMAVMLETMEPKKAAVVVREVTSMEREAWRRVWLTSPPTSGSGLSACRYSMAMIIIQIPTENIQLNF